MEKRILTKGLVNAFKARLVSEERSGATVEKYCRDAAAFAEYADGGEITKELAIAYKNKLKDDGYAVRSVNSMLASVNSLFTFL